MTLPCGHITRWQICWWLWWYEVSWIMWRMLDVGVGCSEWIVSTNVVFDGFVLNKILMSQWSRNTTIAIIKWIWIVKKKKNHIFGLLKTAKKDQKQPFSWKNMENRMCEDQKVSQEIKADRPQSLYYTFLRKSHSQAGLANYNLKT